MIIRQASAVQPVADICGQIFELITAADTPVVNLSEVLISRPTIPHYHRFLTEIYYLVAGSGTIVLANSRHEVCSGYAALIPNNVAHYFVPKEESRLVVVAVPPWFRADQFELENDQENVGYSVAFEQELLIEDLLRRRNLEFAEDMDDFQTYELKEERSRQISYWRSLSIQELRGSYL